MTPTDEPRGEDRKMKHLYTNDYGEVDTWAGDDLESLRVAASRYYRDESGLDESEYGLEFEQIPDDQPVTIREDCNCRGTCVGHDGMRGQMRVTKTAAEWAAECDKETIICSTLF